MRRAAPCTRPARRNGRNASRISRSPSHSRRIQSALTVVASLARGWSVHHLLQCEELSVLPRKEGTGPQAPARLHRQRRWIVVEGDHGLTQFRTQRLGNRPVGDQRESRAFERLSQDEIIRLLLGGDLSPQKVAHDSDIY